MYKVIKALVRGFHYISCLLADYLLLHNKLLIRIYCSFRLSSVVLSTHPSAQSFQRCSHLPVKVYRTNLFVNCSITRFRVQRLQFSCGKHKKSGTIKKKSFRLLNSTPWPLGFSESCKSRNPQPLKEGVTGLSSQLGYWDYYFFLCRMSFHMPTFQLPRCWRSRLKSTKNKKPLLQKHVEGRPKPVS